MYRREAHRGGVGGYIGGRGCIWRPSWPKRATARPLKTRCNVRLPVLRPKWREGKGIAGQGGHEATATVRARRTRGGAKRIRWQRNGRQRGGAKKAENPRFLALPYKNIRKYGGSVKYMFKT